jgi:hypothetical protein
MSADNGGAPLIACNREFIFECEDDPKNQYYRETVKHLPEFYDEDVFIDSTEFSNLILRFLMDNSVGINFAGEPTNMLIRKDVVWDVGMFKTDLVQACDYEYWSRLGSNYGVLLISDVLSKFRIHEGSATNRNMKKDGFKKSHIDLLAVIHDFLYHPVYVQFREVVGETGRRKLLRYASSLLNRVKARARNAGDGDEKGELNRFFAKYPIYGVAATGRHSSHVMRAIRSCIRGVIRK